MLELILRLSKINSVWKVTREILEMSLEDPKVRIKRDAMAFREFCSDTRAELIGRRNMLNGLVGVELGHRETKYHDSMAPRCLEKVRLSQIDLSLEGQAGKP
jgi:hypothetical protein